MTNDGTPRRAPVMTGAWAAALVAAAALGWGAAAQEGGSPFGGFKHDRTQPIEITADSLEVREAEGRVIFAGDVVAGQGDLRLTTQELSVWYGGEEADEADAAQAADAGPLGGAGGEIDRLRADGEVFMTSGEEAARGAWAEYDVTAGIVTMGGGVVLSQGPNAVSGERLRIDLNSGQGRIEGGRVRSVFRPTTAQDE
jgi:lipopolysaccharide export system protein LptA